MHNLITVDQVPLVVAAMPWSHHRQGNPRSAWFRPLEVRWWVEPQLRLVFKPFGDTCGIGVNVGKRLAINDDVAQLAPSITTFKPNPESVEMVCSKRKCTCPSPSSSSPWSPKPSLNRWEGCLLRHPRAVQFRTQLVGGSSITTKYPIVVLNRVWPAQANDHHPGVAWAVPGKPPKRGHHLAKYLNTRRTRRPQGVFSIPRNSRIA